MRTVYEHYDIVRRTNIFTIEHDVRIRRLFYLGLVVPKLIDPDIHQGNIHFRERTSHSV
jgi:hypothetical protein